MITAEQVRKITSQTLDYKIKCLLRTIQELAVMGKRSCRAGKNLDHSEDLFLWEDGAKYLTAEWVEVTNKLNELGYSVSISIKSYYHKYNHITNYSTVIKW